MPALCHLLCSEHGSSLRDVFWLGFILYPNFTVRCFLLAVWSCTPLGRTAIDAEVSKDCLHPHVFSDCSIFISISLSTLESKRLWGFARSLPLLSTSLWCHLSYRSPFSISSSPHIAGKIAFLVYMGVSYVFLYIVAAKKYVTVASVDIFLWKIIARYILWIAIVVMSFPPLAPLLSLLFDSK